LFSSAAPGDRDPFTVERANVQNGRCDDEPPPNGDLIAIVMYGTDPLARLSANIGLMPAE
jgi:hypothetical protein